MKDLTNKKFGDLIVLKRDFLYSKKLTLMLIGYVSVNVEKLLA